MAIDIGKAFLFGDKGIGEKAGYADLGSFVSAILPNVYVFVGLLLFVLFIGGGFVIMTSDGNPEKTSKGMKAITGAVIGFAVVFGSYWIIQIIEKLTGTQILNSNL